MSVIGNFRIGVKLGLAFALVLAMFLATVGYQLLGMHRLGRLEAESVSRAHDSEHALAVDSRLEHLSVIFGDGLLLRDKEQSAKEYNELRSAALEEIKSLKERMDTPEEAALAERLEQAYMAYLDRFEQALLPSLNRGPDNAADQALWREAARLREEAMSPLDAILESLAAEQVEAEQAYVAVQADTERTAMILSGLALVLAGLLGYLLNRSITGPLRQATVFAQALADGDLEHDLRTDRKDETGRLSAALQHVVQSLRTMISEFNRASAEISVGKVRVRAESGGLHGAFAGLVDDANRMLDEVVGYLDNVPMPVMAIDNEFNVLFMNKAGASLGGKDPRALVGTKCFDFFRTGDCRTPGCACDKAMKADDGADSSTQARPGGLELEINYSAVPIHDRSGKVVGALEIVVDQTDIVRAQRKMKAVAEEAADISASLSSAAEELSSQVEESSRGADLQRERTAETATAMEEMNATVTEVSRNASSAASSAGEARERAGRGAEVVRHATEAIDEVQGLAQGLRDNMETLGQQAESIGQVMTVISDIADQTNLLALNAAIEAARAGDAGRGFAVVADEVRKLAEKTMHATGQVGQAIGSIQEVARQAVEATGSAFEAVSRSTEYAQESGRSLEEIVTMVERSSAEVEAIASASEEQSAAAEQITKATEEINRISTETAEAMEQSAQAILELARLAQSMDRLINELKGGGD